MATEIVSVLNVLIETSKDGEAEFRKATEDASSPDLKALLMRCAQLCTEAVAELQSAVRALGGTPGEHGSATGALHRGWVDVKSAVRHRGDHEILADCEKSEDGAKKRYREALDKPLPADIRALIERQYEGVLRNHNQIRDYRDQYAAARH
jgi:uncharacterized protein (TIGR02284 family)